MNQKIQIRKSLYKKEAIIVALQMYLKKYWVAILEDESDYFIQFEPKNGNNIKLAITRTETSFDFTILESLDHI